MMVTKRTGAVLTAVVAALIGALLMAPKVVDLTGYKADLADQLQANLGHQVVIDGSLSLTLLPTPSLTAHGVHVTDSEGAGHPDLVQAPTLVADVRWRSLFGGHIEVSSLALETPRIRLDWLLDGVAGSPAKAAPAGTQPPAPAASPPAEPVITRLRIDQIVVKDGLVDLPRGANGSFLLEVPRAKLSANDTDGMYHLAAQIYHDDRAFSLDGAMGRAGGGEPVPAGLSLKFAQGGGEIRLGGQLTRAGRQSRFSGKASLKLDDLSRAAGGLGDTVPALPAGAVQGEASIAASADQIEAREISLALPGVQATGSATLGLAAVPSLDLTLSATRLDVGRWLSAGKADYGTAAVGGPAETAAAGALGGFSLPRGLLVTADLSADVVTLLGGVARQARLNAALANGEVTLNQASLSLPGNSDINLFGFLSARGGQPLFEGSFEASADDLRGLLQWLKVDLPAVPADRLRTARAAGSVKAAPSEIRLDGGELSLDGMRIQTAFVLKPGEKPALGATIAVDTLNADAYWPKRAPPPPAAAAVAGGQSPPAARLPLPGWLAGLSANLKGQVGVLVARGLTAKEVRFDGSWQNEVLTVNDLSSDDLVGAQVHVTGNVDELPSGAAVLRGVHYDLRSKQPGRLVRQAGLTVPIDVDGLGTIAMTGSIDGGAKAIAIDTRSETGGASIGVVGQIEDPLGAAKLDLTVEASHSSAVQLLRLFGVDYHPAADPGACAVVTKLAGDPGHLRLSDLRLKVGPATAAGQATLTLDGKPRIEADLTSGEIPLDQFVQKKRQAKAAVRQMIDAGLLIPSKGVQARRDALGGDRVTAAPRPSVEVSGIPQRWPSEPIDLSWLKTFDAKLSLASQALTVGRSRFEASRIVLDLADGTLALHDSSARLYGGDLTASGTMTAGGDVKLAAKLVKAQMRNALSSAGDLAVADGEMAAEAMLSSAGHSVAELISGLSGSGKVSVTGGVIRGFDLKAVDERLAGSNSPTSLLTLLQAGLSGGKTDFTSLTATLAASRGVVTVNGLRLTADHGSATGRADINLPDYMIDARAEFRLASAPTGPPLVMRLSGPLEEPHRFLDINEIQRWLVQRGSSRGGRPRALP
jgi:uncharacterized protein involved in outer membrane biogenesis